ncbi:MAG: hypothetical protein LBC68_09750 [Prevotellaceae bacterium]|jgi:hypothetical protein|nr:hypothetical protein [Prevotellaceae bacterium]
MVNTIIVNKKYFMFGIAYRYAGQGHIGNTIILCQVQSNFVLHTAFETVIIYK